MNRRGRLAADVARRSFFLLLLAALTAVPAYGHDFERTRVVLTFSREGSFVLDVTNDLSWLAARLPQFAGGERNLALLGNVFRDRVVLFVDGHEVRPESADFVPPSPHASAGDAPVVATYRLRGRMPAGARVLRWYYGLVVDPYPLTLHFSDGRLVSETVYGEAWSRTFDVSAQFDRPTWVGAIPAPVVRRLPVVAMLTLLAAALVLRTGTLRRLRAMLWVVDLRMRSGRRA